MKTLPHSLDHERSLLASILLDPDCREDIFDLLSPGDFYSPKHQAIYDSCRIQHLRHDPLDAVTVADENTGTDIAKILDFPLATNPGYYAKVILEKSALRKLMQACQAAINECYESQDATGTIDSAQRNILSVEIIGKTSPFTTMAELTMRTFDRFDECREQGVDETAVFTGYPYLDHYTGGFKGGKFIILSARPGVGKTAMMLSMTRNIAKMGTKVGIFSIEMSNDELDHRLLAMETGINALKLINRPWECPRDIVHRACEVKYEWPILLDDMGNLKISELKRRARMMKKAGCKIIFIDQFSKIKNDRNNSNKSSFEERTEVVEGIGDLKKELGIPIVLLAQINREIEKRNNKKPRLSDLKSTGQLEEEADIVLFLHRPYEYDRKEGTERHAELEIAKHRGGPCAEIFFDWEKTQTLYTEAPGDLQPWNLR
jgi:replicative DNA helicase